MVLPKLQGSTEVKGVCSWKEQCGTRPTDCSFHKHTTVCGAYQENWKTLQNNTQRKHLSPPCGCTSKGKQTGKCVVHKQAPDSTHQIVQKGLSTLFIPVTAQIKLSTAGVLKVTIKQWWAGCKQALHPPGQA